MAQFRCPACQTQGTVDDQYIGKKILCPKCRMKLRFVADGVAEPAEEPASAAAPAPAPAPVAGIDAWVGRMVPERFRGAAIVAFSVFIPFVILGAANGMGAGLLMMFFSGDARDDAMLLAFMIVMAAVFMNCISSVLAILGTAHIAPKAPSRLSAGAIAAISSAAGMFCMFVIWTILVVISAAIFLPGSGKSGRGGGGGPELGTYVKIMIVTFVPVVFAAFATGVCLWRPPEADRA
jgi:hypothetical protein